MERSPFAMIMRGKWGLTSCPTITIATSRIEASMAVRVTNEASISRKFQLHKVNKIFLTFPVNQSFFSNVLRNSTRVNYLLQIF